MGRWEERCTKDEFVSTIEDSCSYYPTDCFLLYCDRVDAELADFDEV